MKSTILLSLLVAATPACVLTSAETPGIARWSGANDSSTTSYGTVEVEVGGTFDPGVSKAFPVRLKHGLTEQTEVWGEWSVYEKVERPGTDDGEGVGDLSLAIRHRFWENTSGTSSALEGRVSVPTGDQHEQTGSGDLELYGAALVTQDFEGTRLNGWLEVGILGDALDTDTEMQRAMALSVASNIDERLIGYAELSRVVGEVTDPAYGTLGLGWRATPQTTLDCGVAWGMNDDAEDSVLFIGFTSNLGILGPQGPRATGPAGY